MFIHILMGAVTYYYHVFAFIYLIYQFGQLYYNKRIFLFQWKIENGNTMVHTLIKIVEFITGYTMAYGLDRFNSLS